MLPLPTVEASKLPVGNPEYTTTTIYTCHSNPRYSAGDTPPLKGVSLSNVIFFLILTGTVNYYKIAISGAN